MIGLFDSKAGARTLALDFAIGLFLFIMILGALSVPPTHAFPVPPPSELLPANQVPIASGATIPALNVPLPAMPATDDTPRGLLLGLLGLGFSAMVAFNLAVFRHLRAVYVRPSPDL